MNSSFTEARRLKFPGIEISFAFLLFIIVMSFIGSKYSTLQVVLILGATVVYILLFYLFSIQFVLTIVIDDEGIHYRYPPLKRKEVLIPWIEVLRLRIVKYSAIARLVYTVAGE